MFLFCQRRSPEGWVSNSAHSGFSVFRDWGAVCIFFFSFFFFGARNSCALWLFCQKPLKSLLQAAERLGWQLTAAPRTASTSKFFTLSFFFFCSCQLVLRLYYDRAEPQPGCAFRSKGPAFSDTAVLLLKSRTWCVWDPEPLIWRVDRFRKNKNKKMSFYHCKKKKK